MQPLDPNSNAPDPSPYSAQQSPFSAPQPPVPPPYGGQQPPYGGGPVMGAEKKMPAGICGILLGGFGIHKFILGYTNEGIIMLIASLVGGMLTFGLAAFAVAVIGFIEGIIYLTKSDQQFVQEYVQNKKPWF